MFIAIAITVAISYVQNEENYQSAIVKTLPLIGIIGIVIGLIGMLQNMSDPRAIGPAMAIALLTLLYVSIIAILFNLFKPELCEAEEKTGLAYAGTSLLLIILAFFILIFSFA